MNQDNTGGLRCHDADACAMGQKPCPTPEMCGCAPQAVQPAVPVEVVTDLKNALADATEIRQQLRLMEEHARGDVWRWQADAANELATMGNRMGVLILASDLRNLLAAPAHPAEGVHAPMPVAHPHHCTARTADGSCEECEGHAQAMAEWNTERAALAATHPTQQGLEAEYQRGYQDGYNRRDAEVKGALV